MPDPDPCCAHQAQFEAAVHALARAHGRPEAAERIAWGLPTTQPPDKARHNTVAGLTFAQEDT